MSRVLIIEDEAMLRSSMVRGISKIPSIEIDDVMTVEEALEIIDARPPDLIISDIDLPDRSGLELLGELGRRGLKPTVVFVSGYLTAYRSQIPPNANVRVLEKPVPLEELRSVIRSGLGQTVDEASPFAAADYVQLAGIGRHSVVITVREASGGGGSIHIVSGVLWSAVDEGGDGPDAFARLAFTVGAQVTCRTLNGEPPDQNIHVPWEGLLMDSARMHDEQKKETGKAGADDPFADLDFDVVDEVFGSFEDEPGVATEAVVETIELDDMGVAADDAFAGEPDHGFGLASGTTSAPHPGNLDDLEEIDDRSANSGFDKLWDEGVEALLDKQYELALRVFVAARELRPDDPKVAANIQRLHEMGYDETDDPGGDAPPSEQETP